MKPKSSKSYYWFKGGAVHYAESGVSGMLLHGNFNKAYHSNNLAEQGLFKVGLKTGLWKTWHPNGKISNLQYRKNGIKQGKNSRYTIDANLIEKGKFKNDKKQGIWINYISKDTINYKKRLTEQYNEEINYKYQPPKALNGIKIFVIACHKKAYFCL